MTYAADGDQLALGEVDEVHDAEDERDPEADERVLRAPAETVDDLLEDSVTPSLPHVGLEQVRAGQQVGTAAAHGDLAGAHHVGAVRDLEQPRGVLLDDQHRHPRSTAGRRSGRRCGRRESAPDPGSVRPSGACGVRSSGPGRSPAAAPRRPTGSPPPCSTCRAAPGTWPSSPPAVPPARDGRGHAADLQVLGHGQVDEDPPALGDEGQARPGAGVWPEAGDVAIAEAHLPPDGGHEAGDAVERRRLARAVGPDQADDLTFPDREVDVADRPDRPVAAREASTASSAIRRGQPMVAASVG